MIKQIVLLANSRKFNAQCVAGKELLNGRYVGPWVRPVSNRPAEEVSLDEMRYADRAVPRLLDLIEIPLLGHRGQLNQPENWLLDSASRWRKVGWYSYDDLHFFADTTDSLWANGLETRSNQNDKMLPEEANTSGSSLKLIAVNDLQLNVFDDDFDTSKRRVQAAFSYNGEDYVMWATDSVIEDTYKPRPDGTYNYGPCYLTVSLSKPYKGYCYKLVAGVIGRAA